MKPVLPMRCGQLRPVCERDIEPLVALLHQPEVRRYLCDDIDLPRADIEAMIAASRRSETDGLGLWMIEAPDLSDTPIGVVGLNKVSAPLCEHADMAGGIEPIIALSSAFQRQGVAASALEAVVNYAASQLRLPRLVAAVDKPNVASHRLITRAGFDAGATVPGPAHDLILYSKSLI